jgi:pyruvate/2-oxoacid:ferredoxin oxidoreductase beta subunit
LKEYLKLKRRFRHLTDTNMDQIQEMVNEDWKSLLRKTGEKV